MPFKDQLKQWATQRPDHPAVIAGAQSMSYSQLLASLQSQPQPGRQGISVINEPTGAELVVQFCAAVFQGRTAMVLDAGWPQTHQHQLRELALTWAGHIGSGERPFLLGLSSGTSNIPKGFLRNAASWRESFEESSRYFCLSDSTRTLAPGPLSASMNLYALGESLFTGGTLVVLPQFSADAAIEAITDHAVNRLVLVPAVLDIIVRRALATGADGGMLQHILCAGSALSPEVIELARTWAPNARIQQYYGAAELGFVTASPLQALEATQPPGTSSTDGGAVTSGGVGLPFPGVQLSIRGEDGGEVPAGKEGLVSVKSPYIAQGYAWGDDGLAFRALGDNGWHTVHDRGSIDPEGFLHLAGRASDMIITAGNNVYPHAVEQALRSGVDSGAQILVVGIPDTVRGQRVVAAFYPARQAQGHASAGILPSLRAAAASLPASHRPLHFYELGELPLTGSAKISRVRLAQWIVEGDPRARRRT
ncbi:fatty acid--CoA ligase family protein [Arthrobacter sp. lap29]|uniref:class I adenylate-forming enzyme family protein n=1 Tax=Arthrobacter sp. lap29 TaxID=3056122 RepID=UPI0028F7018F|nr:fatty acid--CoA ligase family protein [Arthrobacter sp. lap29]